MSSLLNTHTPTQIDCIFGLGEGSEVVSLHKQLSDQFFPISSAVAASGTVFYFYFIFFLPAKASCFLAGQTLLCGQGCLGDGKGPPLPGPAGLSQPHACMWFICPTGPGSKQSCSSLLTFLSSPRFPGNGDLHHLAWVHRLGYHRDLARAVVIRCSAQLLMFLSLSLLTLPVAPGTINTIASGGKALCLLSARLSRGYAWTMACRLGLPRQRYRLLILVAAMSNSLRGMQGKAAFTALKLPINTPDPLVKGPARSLGQCYVAISVGLLSGCPFLVLWKESFPWSSPLPKNRFCKQCC